MHTGLSHQRSHLTVKLRSTSISSGSSSAAQLHFRSLIVGFLSNSWPACKHCCYYLVQTGSFLNARLPSYACPDRSAFFVKHIAAEAKNVAKKVEDHLQLFPKTLSKMETGHTDTLICDSDPWLLATSPLSCGSKGFWPAPLSQPSLPRLFERLSKLNENTILQARRGWKGSQMMWGCSQRECVRRDCVKCQFLC